MNIRSEEPVPVSSRKIYIFLFCLWLTLLGSAAQDRIVNREIPAPGCRFVEIIDSSRQLAVYLFKADLKHPRILIRSAMAGKALPGTGTVESIAFSHENEFFDIAGAVNADFFVNSHPLGLLVKDGRLIKLGKGWSSILFTSNNTPHIGVFSCRLSMKIPGAEDIPIDGLNRFRGRESVVLFTPDYGEKTRSTEPGRAYVIDPRGENLPPSGKVNVRVVKECGFPQNNRIPKKQWVLSFGERKTPLSSGLKKGKKYVLHADMSPDISDVYNAVSGGPRLLRDGKISVEREAEGQREGFDTEKHPRTAVGYSRDRNTLILAVVDGRQPGYSLGMDLYSLARLMKKQGCYEAMNLDGGGSATMVVNGEVVNRPSDITGPRPVAAALLVGLRKKIIPAAAPGIQGNSCFRITFLRKGMIHE